jgi:hypothetical protein
MSGLRSVRDGEGDDFVRISDIGKVLDRMLHQAGVTNYAVLAVLDPEGLASLLAEPTIRPGRIGNEDWTGQAARLVEQTATGQADAAAEEAVPPSAESARTSSPKEPSAIDPTALHYQSFVVRILLHESDGRVASTTVQHVGSGSERRWPGLNKPALLDFISAYLSPAGVRPSGGGKQGLPEVPAPNPPGEDTVQPSSSMPGQVSLSLARELRVPHSEESFTVSIALDLTEVEPPAEPPVRFSAVVLARPLSGAAPQVVCREKGIISSSAPVIKLRSAGLPGGTYRLEAVVELIESHSRSRELVASVEGGILVVAGPWDEPP